MADGEVDEGKSSSCTREPSPFLIVYLCCLGLGHAGTSWHWYTLQYDIENIATVGRKAVPFLSYESNYCLR
jgi:hypothetical protein